jgi:hypothetical protein
MKKETATEWLFKQLWDEPKDKFTWNAILSKANEMEEKQHATTFGNALNQMINGNIDFEKYYNHTFKNKEI